MKQVIYVIRHGRTEGNDKGWYYGSTDLPITDDGKKELLRNVKDNIYPDFSNFKKYTSGLRRTIMTLDTIIPNSSYTTVKDLQEFNFGIFERKTLEEIDDEPEFKSWLRDETFKIPDGESSSEFRKRVKRGFEYIIKDEGNQKLLVCHGAVIGVLMQTFIDNPDTNIFSWIPIPGRGYMLEIEDNKITYEEV